MATKFTAKLIQKRKFRWVAKQLKDKKSYVLSLFIGSKEVLCGPFADDWKQSLVVDEEAIPLICGPKFEIIYYEGGKTV